MKALSWLEAVFAAVLVCSPTLAAVEQEVPLYGDSGSDFSKEAFVQEEDSTTLTLENDGTGKRESSIRIRIQSDAALERFGVLIFPYQSFVETIQDLSVRVVKPDGSVVETPSENTQDMPSAITRAAPFYSDLREKHISVKGLSVGDVLESHAVWRITKPLVPGQFWFYANSSPDSIVLHQSLRASLPLGRAVRWSSPGQQPKVSDEGKRRFFTWTSSRSKLPTGEEREEQKKTIAYQSARGRLPSYEIQASSFSNWEEVGAWYNTLARERAQPTAEIVAKAAEITRDAKNDDAKIKAIYNFVSTQIRYIGVAFGIGRYQPHSAAEVLSNQYGDCKDKHTLLTSLLAAVGIRAYPGLVASTRMLDESVPSPGQFDHVITAIPRGDGFLWLDTTTEVAPAGYLLGPLRAKRCLVIPPDKPAFLAMTNPDPPLPSLERFRMKAVLGDTGTLEGEAEYSLTGGDSEVLLRAAFRRTSIAQWRDLVQLLSLKTGFAGEVSDVTASSATDLDRPFRWTYKYKRENYSDWSHRLISPPLPLIALPDEGEKPTHEVWFGGCGEVRFESAVKLPKGSKPRLPPNREIRESFAEYTATYQIKDGTFEAVRRLVVKQSEVPLESYEIYRKFLKAVEGDYEAHTDLLGRARISPVSYQDAIWDLPYSENLEATRAYSDARGALERNDADEGIASLKRAVTIDPKFAKAWLWMGEIYRSQNKSSKSLESFRSAVNSNPSEPLSYKVLAFNLLNLGRLDDAIEVLRELVKVSASDSDGFVYLGWALAEKKRHAEAISAYETSLKLDPQRAELGVPLGTEYLYVNDVERAKVAFGRAADKEVPPSVLNKAALAMAEMGRELPFALEYAEKAVRAQENACAKAALPHLSREDLTNVVVLGESWETLGWVYRRMGRFESAKKYLNAAWYLSQSPVVADRLGQVYEQLHKPEEAAHMFRLALSHELDPQQTRQIQARWDRVEGKAAQGAHPSSRDEMTRLRTTELPALTTATATADFFLLIGGGSKVLESKFVSGDSELKAAVKTLRTATVNAPFPDDGPTRTVRRGVVSCVSKRCSLVLYQPGTVWSVD